jgi:predicted HNH restriction endonuclease
MLCVCANCHRMLHRLGGSRAAVQKLRTAVRAPRNSKESQTRVG